MLKIYGTWLCPDCRIAEQKLTEAKIEFEFIDIFNTTANLKEFLKLRDNNPLYDICKAEGFIGIPTFIREDNSITLDLEEVLQK